MQVTSENLSGILAGPEHLWMERRRRAQILSEGLILSLQIPATEQGLVAWLADADDQRVINNRDAVYSWVLQQLDISGQEEEPGIAALKLKLQDRLEAITGLPEDGLC